MKYSVKAGDTLWDIANLFGVTLDDIVRANNIADPSALAEPDAAAPDARKGRDGAPMLTSIAGGAP